MKEKKRTYENDTITVTYDVARCIHVKACVEHLPVVFDPERRPWIDPDRASPDAVADTVLKCPTGALHFQRHDGGAAETTPADNRVSVFPNGPLLVRGDVRVVTPDDEVVLEDTRIAFCRCGQSTNLPLCDGSHTTVGFQDAGAIQEKSRKAEDLGAEPALLVVKLAPDGPLLLQGPVTVEGADGLESRHTKAALCRCGASANKPFCDGTHRDVGFSTSA